MDSSASAAARRAPAGLRLDAFDGLRAIAAISVVAYHVGRITSMSMTGTFAPLVSELKAGVTIFFVVSGFVIYLPYARAFGDRKQLPEWRRFACRRAVRILPAYWVALTVLALGPASRTVLTSSWWRFYGLTQVYDSNTVFGGLPVAWSLCVEVSFYIALPLFALAVGRRLKRSESNPVRLQLHLIGALALFSVALRLWLTGSLVARVDDQIAPIAHGTVLASSLPGLLDWFALGMALAVVRCEWESGRRTSSALAALAADPVRCWVLAAILFGAGVPWQGGDTFLPLYGLVTHTAIGLSAAAFVLPAVGAGVVGRAPSAGRFRTWPVAFLSSPAMVWLGTISYGIYLWHEQLLDAIAGTGGAGPPSAASAPWLLLATVAGAAVLGAASWYLVERPAQRRWRPPHSRPALALAST